MASLETYLRLALEEPENKWELVKGRVRQKPPGTRAYNECCFELACSIHAQLSERDYDVRCDQGRLCFAGDYLIPGAFVVRAEDTVKFEGLDESLEAYTEPMPFVAEVFPGSTDDYDTIAKVTSYQARGDIEIWLIHPYEHWVTAYLRQRDGQYSSTRYHGGTVRPAVLPISIDLDALFDV